jgi:hypothetical protein
MEILMKKAIMYCQLAAAFALTSGLAMPPVVHSEAGTCTIKALSEVYLEVYDLDRDGNHGPMIWSGRLKDGETARIEAPHARFRYKYNPQPDQKQALTVGPDQWCDSDHTVGVP